MVGAVLFERVFDQGGDFIFEQLNRGVSFLFIVFMATLPWPCKEGEAAPMPMLAKQASFLLADV